MAEYGTPLYGSTPYGGGGTTVSQTVVFDLYMAMNFELDLEVDL